MATTTQSRGSPAFFTAFTMLLLSPLIFPGFFPFDVNLLMASGASLLMACICFCQYRMIYISRALAISFAVIAFIQLFNFLLGTVLAPESWALQSIAYMAAFAMLIVGAATSASLLKRIMQFYLLAATAWSFIGLYVWLGGTDGMPFMVGLVSLTQAPQFKLSGPFVQGNIFASMVGIAWIFSHWLFIRDKKIIHHIAIIFFSTILADTMSRGGLLAFLTVLSLFFLTHKLSLRFMLSRILPAWVTGLIIALILYQLSQPQQTQSLFSLVDTAGASLSARLAIWATAIAEFLSAPLSGVGWGQFAAEFWYCSPQALDWAKQYFGLDLFHYAVPMSAHNLWLHILAEGGMIAFVLMLWGTFHIFKNTISLALHSHGQRLPFALVSTAFLLQSLVNISFTRPLPMLMLALFTGIAFAPWLRRRCWQFRPALRSRHIASIVTTVVIICFSYSIGQWFAAASAIKSFDLQNKASVKNLAQFSDQPRVGALPMIWLGYTVASKNSHTALLSWLAPHLKKSRNEVPWLDTYQVLFYAMLYTGDHHEACQLGKIISRQRFSNEKNQIIYEQVCTKQHISQPYTFGK